MKRILIFAAVVVGGLAIAGIPPSEGGLKADNDSSVLPRAITILDGGRMTNVDFALGRNANAFNIPGTPALSIQCPDAGAWVYTDVTTVGPGTGVKIEAGGFLQTGCAKEQQIQQNDAGVYKGCVVVVAPLAGVSTTQCIVHILRGSFP